MAKAITTQKYSQTDAHGETGISGIKMAYYSNIRESHGGDTCPPQKESHTVGTLVLHRKLGEALPLTFLGL